MAACMQKRQRRKPACRKLYGMILSLQENKALASNAKIIIGEKMSFSRFVVFLLVMGYSPTLLAQDGEPVEYEELPAIKLPVAKEIGEQQDYLPWRLQDPILMSDGTLLVSDLQKKKIEQFNA